VAVAVADSVSVGEGVTVGVFVGVWDGPGVGDSVHVGRGVDVGNGVAVGGGVDRGAGRRRWVGSVPQNPATWTMWIVSSPSPLAFSRKSVPPGMLLLKYASFSVQVWLVNMFVFVFVKPTACVWPLKSLYSTESVSVPLSR